MRPILAVPIEHGDSVGIDVDGARTICDVEGCGSVFYPVFESELVAVLRYAFIATIDGHFTVVGTAGYIGIGAIVESDCDIAICGRNRAGSAGNDSFEPDMSICGGHVHVAIY